MTPLLLLDIPGELPECVLLYGHLDKQPEFTGWLPGLGPWDPVIRDGKLYGRGGADDGYAIFSSLTAIAALKAQGVPLPRCVADDRGDGGKRQHSLAGAPRCIGNENWRAFLGGVSRCGMRQLRAIVDDHVAARQLGRYAQGAGPHGGGAFRPGIGIAPTPFRLLEQLIARIEDPLTGELTLGELHAAIPADRRTQIAAAAQVLGAQFLDKIPFAPGVKPVSADRVELLINNTWRPSLAVTGAEGLPPLSAAGNVLLPEISLKISLRLPPTVDPARAGRAVQDALQGDPPYGAQVSFEPESSSGGWNAPAFAPWFEASMQRASQQIFGRDAVSLGGGGTIPFLRMLGERFPQTQFFVTGVLGPHSNAHGPNEFLHIDYATRLTECVSMVLADFGAHCRSQA